MVNGRAVAVTGSGHYATSLSADVTLATPFNGFKRFSLSGSSEEGLRDLKTIFRLALPDETNFEAEVTLKIDHGIAFEINSNLFCGISHKAIKTLTTRTIESTKNRPHKTS